MLLILSLITFPLLIGLFVIADDFILTLYGPQWTEAILPLRIMIIFTLRHSVGTTSSALFKAVGRTDISFKLGAATIPFYLTAIWLGTRFGIVGVAVAITFVRTIFGLIGFEMMGRCLEQSFWQVIRPMAPAFLASCLMGGVVYVGNLLLDPFLGGRHALSLIVSMTIGGLTYLILLRTIYHSLAEELARVTAPMFGPLQGLIVKVLNINSLKDKVYDT
jgi:PST family polysaccharide transporter